MDSHSKQMIYKGIIQYLLDSTSYTLKNIAELSNAPLKQLRSIYCHDRFPEGFKAELQLLKLYQITLEINMEKKRYFKYLMMPAKQRATVFHE